MQWEHTRKNGNQNNVNQPRNDKQKLLQFVQGLPYGTNIRHHIVGDVGKENKLAVQSKK